MFTILPFMPNLYTRVSELTQINNNIIENNIHNIFLISESLNSIEQLGNIQDILKLVSRGMKG